MAAFDDPLQRENFSPLTGTPVVVLDVQSLDHVAPVPAMLPCVVVAIGRDGAPPVGDATAADVYVTDVPDPAPPWVGPYAGARSVDDLASRIVASVEASPQAAITLAQVLRVTEHLDVPAALGVESLAYATLQSGAEFARWLTSRRAERNRHPPPPTSDDSHDTDASDGDCVLIARGGATLTITLHRPRVHNAFSARMRDELAAALVVAGDPSVTAVHLRGSGPSFCSGGDLDEFGTTPDPATAHIIRTTRSPALLVHELRDRCVAHLHGACIGAGIELAAFATRVIADGTARVQLPEVAMGLIPGAGGTVSIPRRIGRHRAAYLALTGVTIDASYAQRWGLVDVTRSGISPAPQHT